MDLFRIPKSTITIQNCIRQTEQSHLLDMYYKMRNSSEQDSKCDCHNEPHHLNKNVANECIHEDGTKQTIHEN